MSVNKGKWAVIHFPNGDYKRKMNLAIKGETLLSAESAKELIDIIELDK